MSLKKEDCHLFIGVRHLFPGVEKKWTWHLFFVSNFFGERFVHTPGSVSYFFDVEELGQTARVGLHGGPGLNTLQDEYMQKNNLTMKWREDYWASLKKLRDQTVDIFIGAHPGQNRTFAKQKSHTEESNPFIAPEDWLNNLDKLEANYIPDFGKPE